MTPFYTDYNQLLLEVLTLETTVTYISGREPLDGGNKAAKFLIYRPEAGYIFWDDTMPTEPADNPPVYCVNAEFLKRMKGLHPRSTAPAAYTNADVKPVPDPPRYGVKTFRMPGLKEIEKQLEKAMEDAVRKGFLSQSLDEWAAMTRAILHPTIPGASIEVPMEIAKITPRFEECPEEGLEGIWIDGENNPRRVEWNPDRQGLMVSYVKKESYIPGGYCYKIEQFKSLKWKLLEPAGKPPESDGKPETCNHWDPYDLG